MAEIRFTARAEADLASIAKYTFQMWGEARKVLYLRAIKACCAQLAENPMLGHVSEDIRPGLRRMSEGRHVIFYRATGNGIAVSRILHQSMLPQGRIQ